MSFLHLPRVTKQMAHVGAVLDVQPPHAVHTLASAVVLARSNRAMGEKRRGHRQGNEARAGGLDWPRILSFV